MLNKFLDENMWLVFIVVYLLTLITGNCKQSAKLSGLGSPPRAEQHSQPAQ